MWPGLRAENPARRYHARPAPDAPGHVALAGLNLSDDRHVVTESEIGDAQFYVAPPARVTAEVSYRF